MGKIFFVAVVVFGMSFMAIGAGRMNSKPNVPAAWNVTQATNAMSTPFTGIMADSTACTVSTKYGADWRLCRIANVSGTDQLLKVISLDNNDTSLVYVPAGSCTEKLFFIKRVISGAVVDSTRYDFLIE